MPAPLDQDAIAYLRGNGMPITTENLNQVMSYLARPENTNLRPSYAPPPVGAPPEASQMIANMGGGGGLDPRDPRLGHPGVDTSGMTDAQIGAVPYDQLATNALPQNVLRPNRPAQPQIPQGKLSGISATPSPTPSPASTTIKRADGSSTVHKAAPVPLAKPTSREDMTNTITAPVQAEPNLAGVMAPNVPSNQVAGPGAPSVRAPISARDMPLGMPGLGGEAANDPLNTVPNVSRGASPPEIGGSPGAGAPDGGSAVASNEPPVQAPSGRDILTSLLGMGAAGVGVGVGATARKAFGRRGMTGEVLPPGRPRPGAGSPKLNQTIEPIYSELDGDIPPDPYGTRYGPRTTSPADSAVAGMIGPSLSPTPQLPGPRAAIKGSSPARPKNLDILRKPSSDKDILDQHAKEKAADVAAHNEKQKSKGPSKPRGQRKTQNRNAGEGVVPKRRRKAG